VGQNDFDVGYIHFEGHWKGWALKIEIFLGPERATSEAIVFWAKKVEIFRALPFQWPE
jgi:hypothetical protein